jgi:hypothetical protein
MSNRSAETRGMAITRIRQRTGGGRGGGGRSGAGGRSGSGTELGKPQDSGANAFRTSRRCSDCRTHRTVEIDQLDSVRFTAAGPGCQTCEPARRAAVDPAADRPQVVKVWWASGQDVVADLHVRAVAEQGHGQREPSDRYEKWIISDRPAPSDRWAPDPALERVAVDAVRVTLGADASMSLAVSWRPEYCRMLVAQSDALLRAAAAQPSDPDDEFVVYLRLVGAAPQVAAITSEILARAFGDPRPVSLTHAAYALDAAGVTVCMATGHGPDCVAVDALRQFQEVIDAAEIRRVIDGWFVPVLAERPAGLDGFAEVRAALLDRGAVLGPAFGDAPRVRWEGAFAETQSRIDRGVGGGAPRGPMVFGGPG